MRRSVVPVVERSAHEFLVCLLTLCTILSIAACGSSSSAPGRTQPDPPVPPPPPPSPQSFSVSGRVYEVISGTHVPAADVPVRIRVLSPGCTAPVCAAEQSTRTAQDGRYSFGDLPGGRVVVTSNTATHGQVCGATSVLGAATQLDVEISARTSRQPSLTLPPLRVSGQVFQATPAGRAGVGEAEIGLELSLNAAAPTLQAAYFLEVHADANGNYLACGLPANWPIRFTSGFEDYLAWHQFSTDATLDIPRRQP